MIISINKQALAPTCKHIQSYRYTLIVKVEADNKHFILRKLLDIVSMIMTINKAMKIFVIDLQLENIITYLMKMMLFSWSQKNIQILPRL